MEKVSLGLVLGAAALLTGVTLLAGNALADQLVAVGVYCVSVEPYAEPANAARVGERQPQISFRVSSRSEIENELKIFAVAPLNDEVFRDLAALPKDSRVCLMANRLAIRHGLDILMTWDVETCVDFECTNVPRYADHEQGHPLRLQATQVSPPPAESDPSNLEPPLPEARPTGSTEP